MRKSLLSFLLSLAALGAGLFCGLRAHAQNIAATSTNKWEVAVLFLGANEDELYQSDIDANILELARTSPTEQFRLSIDRELPDRSVRFTPDAASTTVNPWDALFWKAPLAGVPIAGEMQVEPRAAGAPPIVSDAKVLKPFLDSAYRDPSAHRMLVIYAHGFGFDGIKSVKLTRLKQQLSLSLAARGDAPSLDILWLDSCFMGNLEAAYELRSLTRYYIASEESEFSAGSPFEMLSELSDAEGSLRAIAADLATQYLDSYSYLSNGSQRKAVLKSSATVSVIETQLLDGLVKDLSEYKKLSRLDSTQIKGLLSPQLSKIRMEKSDLVDLGSLVLRLRTRKLYGPNQEARPALNRLIAKLELTKSAKSRVNPRVRMPAPKPGSRLVYGYENWSKGFEGDADTSDLIPKALHPDLFVDGPNEKRWPSRKVVKRLYLSPFSVGLNVFSFYFIDPQSGARLSETQEFRRERDLALFEAQTEENPVVFSGFTQGVGNAAERYTGLSILDPSIGIPSFSYVDLELSRQSGWGNFRAPPPEPASLPGN